MKNLLNKMVDSVALAQSASNVTFEVLTGALDVPVVHEGNDIPTLATRVRDYLQDAVAEGALDGEDGVSIEEIHIEEATGELFVKLSTDAAAVSLGKIVPDDGVGITDAHYVEDTGELSFELTDGTIVPVGNVRGTDGSTVRDAYVSGNNLYIRTRNADGSDNPPINAGDISRFGGISANDVEIKENGNLVVIFSDGNTRDLGRVVGSDGKRGPSVQSAWLNKNGQLQFLRDDGSQFVTNPINVNILDGTGNTIEDVIYDDATGKLSVKLSADDAPTELGVIKGKDGKDGKDGVVGHSVEDVTIDDGMLLVKLSHEDAPEQVGEVVFYESGDNSLRLTQARVIDDEESPNHKMLEIHLDINGTETTEYIGPVIGDDGVDGMVFERAYINDTNELILVQESGGELNAGVIPQGRIGAIDINDSGFIDVYADEAKTDKLFTIGGSQVKGRDGINGFGITDIQKSGDGSAIIFETTDPDTGDTQTYSLDIQVPYETRATVSSDGFLTIRLSDGSEFERIVKLNGDDGEIITDIAMDSGQLRVTTNKDAYAFDVDYRRISELNINADGKMVVGFSDDSPAITTTQRVAALDGDGVTGMVLEDDNSVTVSYTTDNRSKSASLSIPLVKGTGVYDVNLSRPDETGEGESNDAIFSFKTTNGAEYSIAIPSGVDGYTIEDIIFDRATGNLRIIHNNPNVEDSTELLAGAYAGFYELVITDVKGTTIESIYPSNDPETGADSVQIDLSSGESVHIPILKGNDAKGITDISYDDVRNRLEITTTFDAPNDVVIIEDFVGTDGDRIESITPVTDENGVITHIEMVKYDGISKTEATVTFDVIRGVDGVGLDLDHEEGGISVTETQLTFRTTDGASVSLDQVRGEDATLTLTNITSRLNGSTGNPEIVFEDSNGETHVFEQQKGQDASEALRDISFDGQDLVIDHIADGVRGEFRVTDFRGKDGTTIEYINIDSENAALVIKVSDIEEELVFQQIKGVDGKSITSVAFDGDALNIETDLAQPNVSIPMVRGEDGTTVESITVVDNRLVIEVSDSETPIEFEQMQGRDGDTITAVKFEGQSLVIEHSLGDSPTTVPLVKGEDGITIESIEFDDVNAELKIMVSGQDEALVFPQVKGIDGDGITDIAFEGNDLVINTTIEGTGEIRLTLAEGVSGESIDKIELIEPTDADPYLEINVSSQVDPIRLDIIKGIDGKTITDISVSETNDLIIATDFEGYESIVLPSTTGVDGHGVTSVEFDDVTRNLSVGYSDAEFDKSINIPLPEDGDTIVRMERDTDDDSRIMVETVKGNTYYFDGVFGTDGKDGMNIASFVVDSPEIGDVSILMDDDTDDEGNPKDVTVHVLEGYAKKVESVSIVEETGQLSIMYTGDTEPFITPEKVVGRDGAGRGINTMTFDQGELYITYEDATGVDDTPTLIGNMAMNNVVSADIDEETGMLTFTMDDATTRDVGVVYGRDGRYVSGIRVDDVTDGEGYITERNLVMLMDNGDEVVAGNIKGEAGRSILPMADPEDSESTSGIEVLDNGDIIVRYDNGDAEPVGNIGGGVGLTTWELPGVDDEGYGVDRVVIHDGGMYLSKVAENKDEPPSDKWSPLALGDQIVEVRKPVIIEPRNSETSFSMLPRLVGSVYAPIVSDDKRVHREFEVTTVSDVNFESPIYTAIENADSHDVRDDLNFGDMHLWRCRDLSERDSYSAWSDVEQFEVPPGRLEQPTLNIDDLEDVRETFNAPKFNAGVYSNLFNSEAHVSSDWHIIEVEGIDDTTGNEITSEKLFQSNDTENLTSFVVPFDLLEVSKTYKIRVKYRATTIESLWSDWVEFTTEDTFDYIGTPAIAYDGSESEVRVYNPVFKLSQYEKSVRFATVSTGIPMPHTSSDWEVRLLSSNALIERNLGDTTNLREYAITEELNNETRYLVRGRFFNERFGYSEWSDWLEFRTRQEISQPTITFEDSEVMAGDPIADGTVLISTAFTAINETHVSSDWLFLDIENGDAEVFVSRNDEVNKTSFTINHSDFPNTGLGLSLKVLVRHNGEDISSEYSPQTFIIFLDI